MNSYKFMKQSITPGMQIPPSQIGLPTRGATITSVEFVSKDDGMKLNGDCYRITGAIHPFDEDSFDINFQMGFPVNWNGKMIQYGGGGLDGIVTPIESPAPGRAFMSPSPTTQGYVIFSSDSGHTMDETRPNDCSWALNKESCENYAYKALKKNRDAACYLVSLAYRASADKVYFAGGSNGGRECLKALEQYPGSYDGAICLYPVQSFIAKVIFDNHYGNKLQELGDDAIISSEKWHEIHQMIIARSDHADGAEDGIISNLFYAKAHREETRQMLADELTGKQLAFLDVLATPVTLPFDLGHGTSTMNECAVYEGAPVYEILNNFPFFNVYGSNASARDTVSIGGADQIIRNIIMKDPDFDLTSMDLNQMKENLCTASRLFDISESSLDSYFAKGGKLILLQGSADFLVTPYATIQLYERLLEHCGCTALKENLRFYLVPGYGHGFCENYGMDVDLITALDQWICNGSAPDVLLSTDSNDRINHRTRPLYQYPYYPAYNGSGDINSADSFHPEKL